MRVCMYMYTYNINIYTLIHVRICAFNMLHNFCPRSSGLSCPAMGNPIHFMFDFHGSLRCH